MLGNGLVQSSTVSRCLPVSCGYDPNLNQTLFYSTPMSRIIAKNCSNRPESQSAKVPKREETHLIGIKMNHTERNGIFGISKRIPLVQSISGSLTD